MNTVVIDNKKYVAVGAKAYKKLQEKAARTTPPIKKLTLQQAKSRAHKLIEKLAKEK